MDIQKIIKKTALRYVGQEEIRGNLGFKDKEFEEKMITIGFKEGYAWCALFAELVWKEAYQQYDSFYIELLDKLFSPGAVKTYNNFKKSDKFEVSSEPELGAICIWRNYKDGKAHWTGHAGIVTEVDYLNGLRTGYFNCVEGNTNDQGGREGYIVSLKKRSLNAPKRPTQLRIYGFIIPNPESFSLQAESQST